MCVCVCLCVFIYWDIDLSGLIHLLVDLGVNYCEAHAIANKLENKVVITESEKVACEMEGKVREGGVGLH